MTDLTNEIEALQKALLSDADYRHSWQSNIACAIMDTIQASGESDHEWRNRCANTFLNYLTAGHPDDKISEMGFPGMLSVAVASGSLSLVKPDAG